MNAVAESFLVDPEREFFAPASTVEWHQTFENEFAGTSVSVVLMVAERSK